MNKRMVGGLLALVVAGVIGYWWMSRSRGGHSGEQARAGDSAHGSATAPGHATSGPPAPATLTGMVIDGSSKQPIAGAVVHAATGESDDGYAVRAGADGSFTLADIDAGDYVVSASAPGHAPSVGTHVHLDPGGSGRVTLTLAPGANAVTGTVSDVSGGPVAGAIVRFVPIHGVLGARAADSFAALTGDDGGFSLGVPDGLYRAAVTHPDYVSQRRRVELRGGARQVDFALAPGGAVEGRVVRAADGAPVPFATVAYVRETVTTIPGVGAISGAGRRGATAADADGRFRIGGLESGALRLTARGGGGATSGDTVVRLAIGEQVSGVELVVDSARTVRGRAVDAATNQPVAGVQVVASNAEGTAVPATAATGADGAFVIEGLAPGGYSLEADSDTHLPAGLPTRVMVGGTDVDDAVVKLRRGYFVSGRVEPATVADVGLRLDTEHGLGRGVFSLGNARTGDGGRFRLGPLAAGQHVLEATAADGRTGSATVAVKNADVGDVVISLQDGASLVGRVVDQHGKPVADATVALRTHSNSGNSVTMIVNGRDVGAKQSPTHEDGSFEILGLEAGDYELSVKDDALNALAWSDGSTTPRSVKLAEGQRKEMTLKVQGRDGVIRGVALGPDGKPLPDAWVSATPAMTAMSMGGPPPRGPPPGAGPGGGDDGDGQPRQVTSQAMMVVTDGGDGGGGLGLGMSARSVLTDADGRFEIRDLRRGKYELVGEGVRGAARGFLHAVDTGSDVTLRLVSLARIEGTVTRGGAPVEQFRVELTGPSRRSKMVRDRNGAFQVRFVDPGHYQLRVTGGDATAEVGVDVEAGKPAEVQVDLHEQLRVRGKVADASGAPVVGAMVIASVDHGDGRVEVNIMGDDAPPTTGPDGRFEIGVDPGKYRVLVIGQDSPQPLAMKPVEVTADVDLGTITVNTPPAQ